MLLLLVLQYLRPQDFWGPLYGERVVFLSMMVLAPAWFYTLSSKKVLRTPEELFLFLLWVVVILSCVFSDVLSAFDFGITFGKTLLCCLFAAHAIDTRRKLEGAIWMTVFTLFIVALLAGPLPERQGQYASIGMFSDRNDFAHVIAIMLPLAAAFVLEGRLWEKAVGAVTLVVGVMAAIASQSRGSQLACILGVFSLFYWRAKSKGTRALMLAAAVPVLLVAMSLGGRLGTVSGYRQDRSAMGRVWVWAEALGMFQAHPVLGVGYGKFQVYGERAAHSAYMLALAELGATGLFVYMGLLFFAVRHVNDAVTNPPHPRIRVIALGMAGALVGHMVAALFLSSLYQVHLLVLLAMFSSLRLVTDMERTRLLVPSEAALPGSAAVSVPGAWELSRGAGFIAPWLVTGNDLMKIAGLTFGCWLAYKIFVMMSG